MKDTIQMFKALSSGPRLEIVRLLREHPQCVNALAARLGMSQSAVSQNLRVLKEAGLTRGVKRGNWMHYEMPAGALEESGHILAEVFGLDVQPRKPGSGTRNCPPPLLKECRRGGPSGRTRKGGRR